MAQPWESLRASDAGDLGRSDARRQSGHLYTVDITGFLTGSGVVPPEPLNNLLHAHGRSGRDVVGDGERQVFHSQSVSDGRTDAAPRWSRCPKKSGYHCPLRNGSPGVTSSGSLVRPKSNLARRTRACAHYRKASMMRAKALHPRKSASRCSKREQRRRHPCNRRHTRALAVRRVDSSRADAQGLTRVRRGGPTGAYPSATAQGRVWAPADARALSTAGGAGGGPRRGSNWRPAGAAGAGPGERRAIVRGNQMHRGGPPASGAAEGWRTGCVRAPGPAGGTWTRGRASDRAARVRRPLCSRCKSRRPGRAPRFATRGTAGGRGGGQVPKRAGNPRPVPPCSATDKRAGSTGRGARRTGPRGTGRGGAIRAYGACVRSLQPGDQHHAESST